MSINMGELMEKCRSTPEYKIGILFTVPEKRQEFMEKSRDVYGTEKDLSINVRKCTLKFSNKSVIMALTTGMLDRNKEMLFNEMYFFGNFPTEFIDYVRDTFVYDNTGTERITQFLNGFAISG